MDAWCSWGHRSSLKANKCTKEKVFNQNSFKSQEPGPQPFQCSKNTKTLDRPRKDYKNDRYNRRGRCDWSPYGWRPLGSTPAIGVNTILCLGMTETTTGHRSGRIVTWLKSLITIVTRKSILLPSALSFISQKTSISLGDLHVSDW